MPVRRHRDRDDSARAKGRHKKGPMEIVKVEEQEERPRVRLFKPILGGSLDAVSADLHGPRIFSGMFAQIEAAAVLIEPATQSEAAVQDERTDERRSLVATGGKRLR